MVDEEPPAYRPRRALPSDPPNDEPTVFITDDEDTPKPLYRDEVPRSSAPSSPSGSSSGASESTSRGSGTAASARSAGSSARSAASGARRSAASPSSATDETQILSRARLRAQATAGTNPASGRARPTPRRPSADADATTVLPRTASGARVNRRPDSIDDDRDDDRAGEPRVSRGRLTLLIGAVAAVVVIGLVVGYVIINLTRTTAATGTTSPPPGPSTSTGTQTSATPSPTESVAALLSDASMVTADAAKTLDTKRTWKVALTQRGLTADSPQPACLGGDPADGQPSAQQTILRLVSSNGSDAPALLHQAMAYATPEDAAQAYALIARSIGGCTMTGAYIERGKSVTGLGDQATGVVVKVADATEVTYRNLVLSRTGRVIDILDVARPKEAASFNKTVDVAAKAVAAQCTTAGGGCAEDATSKTAPPPIGGDQPGFLTIGDLPPAGSADQAWLANAPETPDADNKFGGCQTTTFATTAAESRAQRTYLLENGPTAFGLDEVVLTLKNSKAAGDLADKVKSDWESCPTRQLTSTVPKPGAVDGVGAKSAEITGWTTVVSQKSASTTTRYRVGVVAVGSKLVFTFLTPTKDIDVTDDEFDLIAVRAGQRATQVA